MRKVTALEVQKKNPNRVNIYLDDVFAFGLARLTAVWLKVGQELSEEKIAQLQNDDAREIALQKALHYLSYRPRSESEVRKNLEKKEIPPAVIESTLEKLKASKLLGDEDFAKAWVANRNEFRPRGKRALKMELRQKGLAEDVIQEVLNDSVDEKLLALEAARKHARKLKEMDWQDFRTKLGGFLARRGFNYDVSIDAMRRVWKERTAGDSLDEDET